MLSALSSTTVGCHILYPVSDQMFRLPRSPPLTRFLHLDRAEPVVDDFLLLILLPDFSGNLCICFADPHRTSFLSNAHR
jgi:hypothetical protein